MSELVLRCLLPNLHASLLDIGGRCAMDIYQRRDPAPLVLSGIEERCPGGLRPSSSPHSSYEYVSTASGPWPSRRVLLCDSFGPRRSRACVPDVGLAENAPRKPCNQIETWLWDAFGGGFSSQVLLTPAQIPPVVADWFPLARGGHQPCFLVASHDAGI